MLIWNPDLYGEVNQIPIDEKEENIWIWTPKLVCPKAVTPYYE